MGTMVFSAAPSPSEKPPEYLVFHPLCEWRGYIWLYKCLSSGRRIWSSHAIYFAPKTLDFSNAQCKAQRDAKQKFDWFIFLYGSDERGLLFKLTHQRRCSYLHGAIALYMFLSLTRHYWDNEMILSIFSVEFRCASWYRLCLVCGHLCPDKTDDKLEVLFVNCRFYVDVYRFCFIAFSPLFFPKMQVFRSCSTNIIW